MLDKRCHAYVPRLVLGIQKYCSGIESLDSSGKPPEKSYGVFHKFSIYLIALILQLFLGSNGVWAADNKAPTKPATLSATPISSTQVSLSWSASTDNVGVTGYRIERCTNSKCSNFTEIARPTTTSYTNTGLTPSTLYRYRVRAADAAGNLSGYSPIANAQTPVASDTTAPQVIIDSPASGAQLNGIVTVTATASDNVGVVGVQFYVDGTAIGSEDLATLRIGIRDPFQMAATQ